MTLVERLTTTAGGAAVIGAGLAGAAGGAVRRLVAGPPQPNWGWSEQLGHDAVSGGLQMLNALPPTIARKLMSGGAPPRGELYAGLARRRYELGGVPAYETAPKAGATRTILFLHGGGFVLGHPGGYGDLLARLAKGANARVIGLDYRLAPEHPFPAAPDDCLAAWRALTADGTEAARTVVMGDSAGGNLSIVLALDLRDAGEALPAGLGLISPVPDVAMPGDSAETNAASDFLSRRIVDNWIAQYANGEPLDHPRMSPVHADLDGLPPMRIHAGGGELLRDDIRTFADLAQQSGVDASLREWEGLFHDWHLLSAFYGPAQEAAADLVAFACRVVPDALDIADVASSGSEDNAEERK